MSSIEGTLSAFSPSPPSAFTPPHADHASTQAHELQIEDASVDEVLEVSGTDGTAMYGLNFNNYTSYEKDAH